MQRSCDLAEVPDETAIKVDKTQKALELFPVGRHWQVKNSVGLFWGHLDQSW